MKVRLLRDALINQIAAGEVVERPASVVKELLENALDAGATDIAIDLKDGGRTLIEVVDNGEGMGRDDALMALERHATSKIRTADDLARVATLGFRGEALPSIASVSRFELLTRREEDEVGTRVRIEGGELRDVRDAGAAPGTEVRVRNLFFNVPVRRRFLRTATTEVGHCADVVLHEAMVRPDVAFSMRHGGRSILDAPVAEDVASRVSHLLGGDARSLVPCRGSEAGVTVEALIAPPAVTRSSARQATFLYVNGRFVRDKVLQRAVREAYRGRVVAGRFPVVVLRLELPAERVDVNVHPAKVEVRFRDPRDVGSLVTSVLRQRLEGLPGTVHNRPWQRRPEAPRSEPLPFAGQPSLPAHPDDAGMPRPLDVLPAEPPLASAPTLPPTPPSAHLGVVAEPEVPIAEKTGARCQVVGLLRDRVLLADDGVDLLLIEIGAARTAVARAELARDALALGGAMRLLVPRAFAVGERVREALEARSEDLRAYGVEIGAHGGGEVLVKAAPAGLRGVQWEELLPRLAASTDLVATLAQAHAETLAPPSEYGRRALLAAVEELDLLPSLARRVSVATLLGEG